MAFKPLNFEEGMVVNIPAGNGGSSQAFVKGDALIASSGYYIPATGGNGTAITHVAMENKTVTVNGTPLAALPVVGGTPVRFEADCDAAWSIVDQGTYADLATAATVNPDATTDDLFFIEQGIGTAETDTKVIGYFVQSAANVE